MRKIQKETFKSYLHDCIYKNEKDCLNNTEKYFEFYNDTTYSTCARFDNGKNIQNDTTKTVSSSGRNNGLTLVLKEEKGVLIWIHNNSRLPIDIGIYNDLNENTITASTNYSKNLILIRIQTDKLEQPYNDCLNDIKDFPRNKTIINAILSNNQSYYQQHCLKYCFELKYIDDNPCNCTAPLGNVLNECYFLNKQKELSDCTIKFKNNFNKNICSQYCPLECDSVIYQNSYSIMAYPQGKNQVKVLIYYGELKYTLFSQQAKMAFFDLISNLGGIMGVFLGMSFLSFIEMVEIIYEILIVLQSNKVKNKVEK